MFVEQKLTKTNLIQRLKNEGKDCFCIGTYVIGKNKINVLMDYKKFICVAYYDVRRKCNYIVCNYGKPRMFSLLTIF